MSVLSHWPKASQSLLSQYITEESKERNGKDERPITGNIRQQRLRYGCKGRKRKTIQGLMKKPNTKTREWDGKIGTSHCRWKRVNKNQRGGIR